MSGIVLMANRQNGPYAADDVIDYLLPGTPA